MKAGSCTVCTSPQRAEIDAAALAGTPLRTMATMFGRGKNTLQRHVVQHITAAAQKAAGDDREIDAGQHILDELERIRKRCDDLLKLAEKKKDLRNGFTGIREMRGIVTDTARILGIIHDSAIHVDVHLDEATAVRMAETFIARRSKPVITIEAQHAAEVESAPRLQVTENERVK